MSLFKPSFKSWERDLKKRNLEANQNQSFLLFSENSNLPRNINFVSSLFFLVFLFLVNTEPKGFQTFSLIFGFKTQYTESLKRQRFNIQTSFQILNGKIPLWGEHQYYIRHPESISSSFSLVLFFIYLYFDLFVIFILINFFSRF